MMKTKVNSHPTESSQSPVPDGMRDCPVLHTFRPVMRILQLCGAISYLPVSNHQPPCSGRSGDRPRRKASGRVLRIIYMAFLYILGLSSAVRLIYCVVVNGISTESGESLILLTIGCVSVASAINITCLIVRLCLSLPKFFACLCFMHYKYDISAELKKFRKWSICGCVLVVVVVLSTQTSIVVLFGTIFVREENGGFFYFLTCPFRNGQSVALDAILIFLFLITCVCSVLILWASFVAYVGFCYISGSLFLKLAKQLDNMSISSRERPDSGENRMKKVVELKMDENCMENAIEFHQDVCEFVSEGNLSFNHYIPCLYIMTIPSICFVSNALMQLSSLSGYLTVSLTIEIVMISFLTATVWIGAQVSSKADAARDSLFRLNTQESSNKQLQLACFFAAKLNSPGIGVKFFDIFVIDKAHILTMFGILITYTLLILQFDASVMKSKRETTTTMATSFATSGQPVTSSLV